MGNFTKLFKTLSLILFLGLGFQGISAQTFNTDGCDAQSVSGCTLVADDNPGPAAGDDAYAYLLVDGDCGIIGFSNDGSFDEVTAGTYCYYYVSYNTANVDATALAAFFALGGCVDDLEAYIAANPDAGITLVKSDPVSTTYTPAECLDFDVVQSAICNPGGTEYQVLLVFQGGDAGTGGYVITDDLTGDTYGPLNANSITFGPYAQGTGYSYTVSVANNPQCSMTAAVTTVSCTPTSIDLLRFNAEAQSTGNFISWTTASEDNTKLFSVEYSENGVDFKEVGTKLAAGNSNINQVYSFLHKETNDGVHYYRLKEVDFDNNIKIVSRVVSVDRTSEDFTISNVFPVPATDNVNVLFVSKEAGNISVEITDITGKVIARQATAAERGLNQITLDVKSYAAGNYFVTITNGTSSVSDKFVKN